MKITGNYIFGGFGASHGRNWMKIGGNQADAFPDLPIQPKTLDFHKTIQITFASENPTAQKMTGGKKNGKEECKRRAEKSAQRRRKIEPHLY